MKFTMVVEPTAVPRSENPFGFEREFEWLGDEPPDLITIGDGLYMKVGKLLSPFERYNYRRPTQAIVSSDKLYAKGGPLDDTR